MNYFALETMNIHNWHSQENVKFRQSNFKGAMSRKLHLEKLGQFFQDRHS